MKTNNKISFIFLLLTIIFVQLEVMAFQTENWQGCLLYLLLITVSASYCLGYLNEPEHEIEDESDQFPQI